MYIVSSTNMWRRFSDHINDRSSNIYLQRAFNKHGLNSFSFNVLEFCLNATELSLEELSLVLIKMEQKYLDLIAAGPTLRRRVELVNIILTLMQVKPD